MWTVRVFARPVARSLPTMDIRTFDAGATWQGIAPEARTVWRAGGLIGFGLVGLIGVAALLAGGAAVAASVWAATSLTATVNWWWMSERRYRAWGYAQREKDLLIRRGLLIRRLTVVPYGRMQFVDVRQGPIARRLGLADVELHSAAAATNATVPMLAEDDARRLADRLTALGEAHAAGI